jgi:acyl-CoA hydrolase
VATAYLVFVGVDASGKPREVPPVHPGDPADERRFAEAEIRRQHRLARRRAISAHRGE